MNSIQRLLLALLPLALLSACGIAPIHTAEFPLMAPSTLGATRNVQQILHGAFGEHEIAFQCVVDVNPKRVVVIGLDAMGQRWFSLNYDGSVLLAETNPQVKGMLDPRSVLADLQLALWPLQALQDALTGSAWQVSEPVPGTRRLRRNGRLIEEAHYAGTNPWKGRLWLSNFETGYSLAIESQTPP